jgi:hypothetical protein
MHALRMAVRALRATPGVSALVVLTLALGIGANSAIFSVVNSLLLRTLPVPEPRRLVTISSDYALAHGFKAGAGWNYEMWTRLQQLPPLFDGMLMWSQPDVQSRERWRKAARPCAARQRQLLPDARCPITNRPCPGPGRRPARRWTGRTGGRDQPQVLAGTL